MTTPRIIICDEHQFLTLHKKPVNEKWACIRIASNKHELAPITKTQARQFAHMHHVYFTDITHDVIQNGVTYKTYNQDHHDSILAFTKSLEKKGITHVYIHCHAGAVRSPSVGTGLHQHYGWDIQYGTSYTLSYLLFEPIMKYFNTITQPLAHA